MHFVIVNVLQCVCGAYAFCQCIIITVIVMIRYIYKASFLTGDHSVLQLLTTVKCSELLWERMLYKCIITITVKREDPEQKSITGSCWLTFSISLWSSLFSIWKLWKPDRKHSHVVCGCLCLKQEVIKLLITSPATLFLFSPHPPPPPLKWTNGYFPTRLNQRKRKKLLLHIDIS